nr:protein FATTY ACID EXPORT 1, chloroplastic isoform X2 [Solanum lycopersicum]
MKGSVQENSISPSKRTAKIHDFCFGIPFGSLVFTGGIVGFIFSRNPATLSNGVLFGGALLAFSTISLRVWRQGKSSLPFILGQAVLAAVLLWKNMQTFSLFFCRQGKYFPLAFMLP